MAPDHPFFRDLTAVSFDENEIAAVGQYHPWGRHRDMGGDRSNYPAHSGRILDIKDGHDHAVEHFFSMLDPLLAEAVAIAIVPSHDPEKHTSALRRLGQKLAASKGRIDATHCLVRHTKIAKLAGGGDRSVEIHTGSIRVEDAGKIVFENVIVLDDVSTSGNSLIACKQLLLPEGATVQCLVLGKTV